MMQFKLGYGHGGPPGATLPYGAGANAYLDTLTGLVPVRVIEVSSPGRGSQVGEGRIIYRVKQSRPSWPKGHEGIASASQIVPINHVRKSGKYGLKVDTNYEWVKTAGKSGSRKTNPCCEPCKLKNLSKRLRNP